MINAKTKFVAVNDFNIDPGDLPGMARETQLVAQRIAPLIDGFIECVIMANEERTRLLIVSLWESKHAWSAAQWNQDIGRVITDVAESAQSLEVHTYETISVVRVQG